MLNQNQSDESQSISSEKPNIKPSEADIEKPIFGKFTKKQLYVTLAIVTTLLIGAGVAILIVFLPKDSNVQRLDLNQRDDFQQLDEICVQHQSQNMRNCTQVHVSSSRFVQSINSQNATSALLLTHLKVNQYTLHENGTKTFENLTEENQIFEQQLRSNVRLLQGLSSSDSDLCYNISASECGNVDSLPLLTIVTDQETGQVTQIGIPQGVDDSLVQPLVSNIIHVGANMEEAQNLTTNGTRRLLTEDFKNLYKVGKLQFYPKYSVTKSFFGQKVITKSISKQSNIGNEKDLEIFQQFDQNQDTILDRNNYLVSSHVKVNSLVDNSISSQDPQDIQQQSQTSFTADSDLITVETKTDADGANAINEIRLKQSIAYFSLSELSDRLTQKQEVIQSVEIDDQDNQNGNRILEDHEEHEEHENDTPPPTGAPPEEPERPECQGTTFQENKILKEVKVLGQKITVTTEFSGKVDKLGSSGIFNSCVRLNDNCITQLQNKDFSLAPGNLSPNEKDQGNQAMRIFSNSILILAYPVNVGSDLVKTWTYEETYMEQDGVRVVTFVSFTTLSLTAYGELNIVWVIKIQTGVSGTIYNGNQFGVVTVGYNKQLAVYQPKIYAISLSQQTQGFTLDLYAKYSILQIGWHRSCIGRRWWRICWYWPSFSYSDWRDIYRYPLLGVPSTKVSLFEKQSECLK